MREVVPVLDYQMNVPVGIDGFPDSSGECLQQLLLTPFHDVIVATETQPVEAIFLEPVQCIMDREVAYGLQCIVDRISPGSMRVGGEEIRCVCRQKVPLRSEMIVDHVKKDHQTAAVGLVDQSFEVVGFAVYRLRRIELDAVIAPIALSRKFRD